MHIPRLIPTFTILALSPALDAADTSGGEWHTYGGDLANTRYAPHGQINAENFGELEIAWQFKTDAFGPTPELRFQSTPLMVDGVLYGSTSLAQATAIDARTGSTLWTYDPESYKRGRRPNIGFISRGVAYWEDGSESRIYYNTGD